MSEWLPYPEHKPEEEGLYVVAWGGGDVEVRRWLPERRFNGGTDPFAFFADRIPECDPVPPPTTIEWERIPEDLPTNTTKIVLSGIRPLAAFFGPATRKWIAHNIGPLDPQPKFWAKEQA